MLILASVSPRRRELLSLITANFATVPPDVDEDLPTGVSPEDAVQTLALRKALRVAEGRPEDTVLGADTVVVLDRRVLGKPSCREEAVSMLRFLSGREHMVYTGAALVQNKRRDVFFEVTAVRFRDLPDQEIKAYVDTGEPMDKAGAYGIQGRAALFVSGITGDFYNVVGLPICALSQKLANFEANTKH